MEQSTSRGSHGGFHDTCSSHQGTPLYHVQSTPRGSHGGFHDTCSSYQGTALYRVGENLGVYGGGSFRLQVCFSLQGHQSLASPFPRDGCHNADVDSRSFTVKAGIDAGPATGGQQSSQAQEPKLAPSAAGAVTSKAQSLDLAQRLRWSGESRYNRLRGCVAGTCMNFLCTLEESGSFPCSSMI